MRSESRHDGWRGMVVPIAMGLLFVVSVKYFLGASYIIGHFRSS